MSATVCAISLIEKTSRYCRNFPLFPLGLLQNASARFDIRLKRRRCFRRKWLRSFGRKTVVPLALRVCPIRPMLVVGIKTPSHGNGSLQSAFKWASMHMPMQSICDGKLLHGVACEFLKSKLSHGMFDAVGIWASSPCYNNYAIKIGTRSCCRKFRCPQASLSKKVSTISQRGCWTSIRLH